MPKQKCSQFYMEKTILNYLLEKSSQAYLSINLNGEILDCNPKASELFGYSIHEIKALPITNLFLDNAQKLLFSDLLAEGEITSVVDAVGKNGKQFSLELSGKVIPDDKACDKRIVLLGQMSTKGARTSAMSAALEEDLGRVIESVNVGIVVHNEHDEIIHFNLKALELLGVSEDFLLGKTAADEHWSLIKENHEPFSFDEIPSTIARKHRIKVEGVVIGSKTGPGKINWLQVDANPSYTSRGEPIVIVSFADITALKNLQYQLLDLTRLLEETNTFARIGSWEFEVRENKMKWTSITRSIYEVDDDFIPSLEATLVFYQSEDTRNQICLSFNELLKEGKPCSHEFQIQTAKGRKVWIRIKGNAELKNRECIRLFGTVQDIDSYKQKELELSQRQSEIVQIYNTISDVVFKIEVMGPNSYKFVTVNDAFCVSTGFTRDQVVNHYTYEVIPEPSLSLVHSKYAEAIEKRQFVEWEETTEYAGELKTGIVRVSPLFNEEGACTHLIGNVHDVSEIRQAAKAAEEALNKLNHQKFALDQHSIVVVTNSEREIIYVNDKFCEISGYSREELLGRNHSIVKSGVHPPSFFRELYETIYSGKVWHGDICNKKKDGSLYWVRTTIVPFQEDPTGKPTQFIAIRTDITNERKSHEALKVSEEYLRTVFDYSLTAIVVADDAGRYLDVNPFACELFGYSREEFLRMQVKDIQVASHQSAGEQYQEYINKGIDKGDFQFYTKNGKLVSTLYQAIRIRENFNVSIMIDITERMEFEQQALRNQQLLEEVFNNVSDVIFLLELDETNRFKYLMINHSFTRLTGLPEKERINQYLDDVASSPLKELELDKYWQAIRTRSTVVFQETGVYPNGVRTVVISATPLFDSKGAYTRLICSARDITDVLDTQNKIRRLSLIASETINGAVITDVYGRVVWVNKAFERTTGFSLGEMIGKKPGEVLQGEGTDPVAIRQMHDAIESKKAFDVEVINYSKAGEPYWIRIQCQPLINSEGVFDGFFAIETDITKEKEAKIEREQLIQELTAKNKDLRQFTFIASHNLRAPLTNLVAISNLLELPPDIDESTKTLIDGFKVSTFRLRETLDDLINILLIKESKSIQLEPLLFQDTLNKVCDLLNNSIAVNQAKIEADFTKAPQLKFSPAYLESIFLNLITNSLKYRSQERNPHIKLKSELKEGKIVLIYEDNGSGFNYHRVKDRLFGLYQRFHKNHESKGIGLYLIKSQINALGGDIDAESWEGVGTRFTLTFKVL